MQSRINQCSDNLQQLVGKRDALRERTKALLAHKDSISADAELYSSVRYLLEVFTKGTEVKVRQYIEPIITEALDFVFNQGLYFHLLFVNRRDQMEVDFFILRNKELEDKFQLYITDVEKYEKNLDQLVKETKNIPDIFGGAVNQVLSCVLRFAIAELLHIKGPIFMDEPSSAVHPTYATRLGQLISSLSKRFNRQYVIVTHSRELASFAEEVYEVSQVNGISKAVKTME